MRHACMKIGTSKASTVGNLNTQQPKYKQPNYGGTAP